MVFSKFSSNIVLVMIGAIPGTLVRYFVVLLFPTGFGLPMGTLLVNVFGSFVLGMIVTMFRIGVISSDMVSMIGIGFSGSLTTMSAFAFESINLINNSYGLFIINILFTLLFVLLGAYLGRTLAQYLYLRSDT